VKCCTLELRPARTTATTPTAPTLAKEARA
jgi:hypothetical protein